MPTGWLYEMKKKAFPVRSKGSCSIHLVPYSEHSNYAELREFVRFIRPHQVMNNTGDGVSEDGMYLRGGGERGCLLLYLCAFAIS